MTLREALGFLRVGASVVLLSLLLLLLVGARRLEAADGGGMSEVPGFGRGGCRVLCGGPGPLFGSGIGRGRGAVGGGIRELGFVVGGRWREGGCDEAEVFSEA